MNRYIVFSLVLHAIVIFSFSIKRSHAIDDPIVSVSLNLDQTIAPSARPKPLSKNNPTTIKKTEVQGFNLSPQPDESTHTTAYESGNVSVKPKVLKQVQVPYPPQAKEARIEGAVRLSVLIDETGAVSDVSLIDGPGYGMNEAAEGALRQFIFSPAEVEGKKVPVRIVYSYRFKLESR